MLHRYFLFFIITILASCGQDPQSLNPEEQGAEALNGQGVQQGMACSCAYQYDPVCGENGITYTNACIANCQGVNYTKDACKDGNKACNPSSGYVCGQPPCESGDCADGMPHARAYSNECIMMQADGAFIHEGLCR